MVAKSPNKLVKLHFNQLDNAHNRLKIEVKQRKAGFMQRNHSLVKFEENSS